MRVLVVGTGSIGTRHSRNLAQLSDCEVGVVHRRPWSEVDPALHSTGTAHFSSLSEALTWQPDAAVVANATSSHVETALALARNGVHLLVEKPLSHNSDGIGELIETCHRSGRVLMVGYCLRFLPALRRLRQYVAEGTVGQPLVFLAECGQYLPSWRPGTDYRRSVTARSELGGGALLELSHEIDYAMWICGPIVSVGGTVTKTGALDIDVDDVCDLVVRFASGATGAIHLDLWQRPAVRTCKMIGTEGSLQWAGPAGGLSITSPTGDDVEPGDPKAADLMYVEELGHFVDCIRTGARPEVTGEDAWQVVRVCEAARRASQLGREVEV